MLCQNSNGVIAGMAQVPAKPNFQRELTLRIVSSVVIVPVVAFADYNGGLVFNLLLLFVCATMAWEWGQLSGTQRAATRYLLAGIACVPVLIHLAIGTLLFSSVALVASSIVATLYIAAFDRAGQKRLTGIGIAYVTLACLSAIWIRGQVDGFGFFTLLLIIVIVTDVFAFICGRLIGGPKVAPSISPNKTWSGALGGLFASSLAAFLFISQYHGTPNSPLEVSGNGHVWLVMLAAACLSVASQAGDFFESWLKRRADVKDSGSIIPGHGGMLDRLDGFLAATPVLAIMLAGYTVIASA